MISSLNKNNKVSNWKQKGKKMTKQTKDTLSNIVANEKSKLDAINNKNDKLMKEIEKKEEDRKINYKENMKVLDRHIQNNPVNPMSQTLMTKEVVMKDMFSDNEIVNKTHAISNFHNFYSQIENNILVGAKAIYLVCRDLADAQKKLPGEMFSMLKEKVSLSDATISKYMKIGNDTTCRELFQLNKLPESWTTQYEIAKLEDKKDLKKVLSQVDVSTTKDELHKVILGRISQATQKAFEYAELISPRKFIEISYDGNHIADPTVLAELKVKVENAVNKVMEDFHSENQTRKYETYLYPDSDGDYTKVEVASNKTLLEKLFSKAQEKLKKIKGKVEKKDAIEDFEFHSKKASNPIVAQLNQ
jgi:hypothetical protein